MRRLLLAAACVVGCMRPQALDSASRPAQVVRGPRANIEPGVVPVGPTQLRIIGTNDFHGALDPRPDETGAMRGGAAYLAAAIKAAEAECRPPACVTILLDAGDAFQGTAASNFVFGRSVIDVYNYLGFAAAALGNHEFDWGQDTLRSLMKATAYPILGANVRYKDGRDVPWIRNDTIIKRAGLSIGVIGVSTVDTPLTSYAEYIADLTFVDPVPIIDSIAPLLRARGAQFVIVVGHVGARCSANGCSGEALDLAGNVRSKIDAIISGHSHTRVDTDVKGIPVVQARSRGQAIDVVDLFVGGAPPRHEVREIYADSIAPNADVRNMVAAAAAWLDKIAPEVNRPIAEIATTMRVTGNQYGLGNLIADAMRVVGRGDVAIMNNGGIRQVLPAGSATFGRLYEVLPFGNELLRIRVRGADLRNYFGRALERGVPDIHVSGARIVYHAGATTGIDSITILGRPLRDQAVYTVILNDFSAKGGDRLGFGAAAISTTSSGAADIDALTAYVKSLPQPVSAPVDQRIILRP